MGASESTPVVGVESKAESTTASAAEASPGSRERTPSRVRAAVSSQEQAALVIQKHLRAKAGQLGSKALNSAKKLRRRARQVFLSVNFLGKPVHGSVQEALEVGSPEGANWYERKRDWWLLKMVEYNHIFFCILVVALVGLVGFAILLVVCFFALMFKVPMGAWTENVVDACNVSQYNQSLVIFAGDSTHPPRVKGVGEINEFGDKDYVAYYCTNAQFWFNLCVKYFTYFFTYVNILPVPWVFAILVDGMCPRPCWQIGDRVGVDFYGRSSESLWFHLPRRTRAIIAALLFFALITQILACIFHSIWWEYLAGQTWPGGLLQNIWLALQFVAQIAAGCVQGQAEKKVRESSPERFPPVLGDYLKEAYLRWRQKKGAKTHLCCGPDSFLHYVMDELKEFNEEKARFGKVDALTGIQLEAIDASPDERRAPSRKRSEREGSKRSGRSSTRAPDDVHVDVDVEGLHDHDGVEVTIAEPELETEEAPASD